MPGPDLNPAQQPSSTPKLPPPVGGAPASPSIYQQGRGSVSASAVPAQKRTLLQSGEAALVATGGAIVGNSIDTGAKIAKLAILILPVVSKALRSMIPLPF